MRKQKHKKFWLSAMAVFMLTTSIGFTSNPIPVSASDEVITPNPNDPPPEPNTPSPHIRIDRIANINLNFFTHS